MANLVDLLLYIAILSPMFLVMVVLCWFFENTKIGRKIMDYILWRMGV